MDRLAGRLRGHKNKEPEEEAGEGGEGGDAIGRMGRGPAVGGGMPPRAYRAPPSSAPSISLASITGEAAPNPDRGGSGEGDGGADAGDDDGDGDGDGGEQSLLQQLSQDSGPGLLSLPLHLRLHDLGHAHPSPHPSSHSNPHPHGHGHMRLHHQSPVDALSLHEMDHGQGNQGHAGNVDQDDRPQTQGHMDLEEQTDDTLVGSAPQVDVSGYAEDIPLLASLHSAPTRAAVGESPESEGVISLHTSSHSLPRCLPYPRPHPNEHVQPHGESAPSSGISRPSPSNEYVGNGVMGMALLPENPPHQHPSNSMTPQIQELHEPSQDRRDQLRHRSPMASSHASIATPTLGDGDRATHEPSSSTRSTAPLFCICQQPFDGTQFMLACDQCNRWFHGKCVNITEEDAKRAKGGYTCAACLRSGEGDPDSAREDRQEQDDELSEDAEEGVQDHISPQKKKRKSHHQRGERLCRFPGCDKHITCRSYCPRHQKQKERAGKRGCIFSTSPSVARKGGTVGRPVKTFSQTRNQRQKLKRFDEKMNDFAGGEEEGTLMLEKYLTSTYGQRRLPTSKQDKTAQKIGANAIALVCGLPPTSPMRKPLLKALGQGLSQSEIAEIFHVSKKTVERSFALPQEENLLYSLVSRPRSGKPKGDASAQQQLQQDESGQQPADTLSIHQEDHIFPMRTESLTAELAAEHPQLPQLAPLQQGLEAGMQAHDLMDGQPETQEVYCKELHMLGTEPLHVHTLTAPADLSFTT